MSNTDLVFNNEPPLILVFYMNNSYFTKDSFPLLNKFIESVNMEIAAKEANIMGFFLPTSGDDRLECINPKIISEVEKVEVDKLLTEIREKYDFQVSDSKEKNEE